MREIIISHSIIQVEQVLLEPLTHADDVLQMRRVHGNALEPRELASRVDRVPDLSTIHLVRRQCGKVRADLVDVDFLVQARQTIDEISPDLRALLDVEVRVVESQLDAGFECFLK